MQTLRKSSERGYFDHGWLKTFHSFSFADYYDPAQMGFRDLRVINEDRIAAGRGFGTHSHRNMEIISYVVSGALTHKDSMGNGSVIAPGDFQYMAAGSGVTHSEWNELAHEETHLLQIWILPNQTNLKPRYAQVHIDDSETLNQWKLIAGPEDSQAPIIVHQDVKLYQTRLMPNQKLTYELASDRHAYLQIVEGKIMCNGIAMNAGDGLKISNEEFVKIISNEDKANFLLFDLI